MCAILSLIVTDLCHLWTYWILVHYYGFGESQWEDENSLTCTPVVYETGHPQYDPLFFVYNS